MTPFPSELPFASLVAYSPRGNSEEARRSRTLMRQVTTRSVDQLGPRLFPIVDGLFGDAAVGADGHESLVSAYGSPVRQSADVKVVK